MPNYQPPFTITASILNSVAAISEIVGRLSMQNGYAKNLKLRRRNQVLTIHGSLAIEGNTLSEEQIAAILDGKSIIAPPKEILEAKNTARAYSQMDVWEPSSQKDLLAAHGLLMQGLIDEAGQYRTGGVGVMAGDVVVHMAPQADRIPVLMSDLLAWLKNCEHPLLISSCVFHYEFEFIHPFSDGNGRMGRLWQSLILSHWDSIFTYLPIESLIHQHQQNYYRAIRQSTTLSDSAPFIEFILQMILDALPGIQSDGVNDDVNDDVNEKDRQLLSLLQHNEALTQSQLAENLGLSKSTIERRIRKLKQLGILDRVGSDKTGKWKILVKGLIREGSKK